MSTFKPYRPANGTEGSQFEAEFCNRCVHDNEPSGPFCEIHNAALAFGINDELYPRDTWVYFPPGPKGRPVCLAFRERGGEHQEPFEPDPAQTDLFVPLTIMETATLFD